MGVLIPGLCYTSFLYKERETSCQILSENTVIGHTTELLRLIFFLTVFIVWCVA